MGLLAILRRLLEERGACQAARCARHENYDDQDAVLHVRGQELGHGALQQKKPLVFLGRRRLTPPAFTKVYYTPFFGFVNPNATARIDAVF